MIPFSASENVQMALDAVWSHRFRSALTILGIVIGISTVVTVGSITTGLRQGIVTFFEEFGPNNIFLNRVSGDPSAPGAPKEQKRKQIDPYYAEIAKESIRSLVDVSKQIYVVSETSGLLTARVPGYETDNIALVGLSANTNTVNPRELSSGRYFTVEEENRGQRVCVIGALIAEALFPDGNALGRVINVAGGEYLVVGVLAKAKGGFFGSNGIDQQIAMPFTTARMRFPTENRVILVFQARPGMRDEAFEEIKQLLRRLRKTPAGEEDDFSLTTADQIISRLDGILRIVILVSLALSSLGLLVGGIGVMNIMLVSVTERTKEIGVRKAIGAKKFDIILQFLTEAVTLTGIGGLLGILISVALVFLIGVFVPAIAGGVPGWALGMGFGASVTIGIFFGTWPAVKAAQLDPVEALRYE